MRKSRSEGWSPNSRTSLLRLHVVDVFAEAALEGNQLAVVREAQDLSPERMQDIAREMNFSETTFVISESAERARVRIFTPQRELPFAGHPTLGTAWVLGRTRPGFTLDLDVGPVEVTFEPSLGESKEGSGICWMSPPMPEILGTLPADDAASLLNLKVDELALDFAPTLMRIGPEFAIIGVRNDDVLSRTVLNVDVRKRLLSQGLAASSVFVFCPSDTKGHAEGDAEGDTTDAPIDYAARMFFDAGGIREDPATGSANSAFAIYLRDLCGVAPGSYVVAQGDYIKRPSRIYLHLEADSYRVGGKVQSVVVGEFQDTCF